MLLVDDEARVLSALRRSLRRLPIELETAPDAARALERLAAGPPVELVISDQRMPGPTGIALLQEVRRRWPATRRVLLTGWGGEVAAADRKAAGLHALLSKPWDDAELKATIRELLGLDA